MHRLPDLWRRLWENVTRVCLLLSRKAETGQSKKRSTQTFLRVAFASGLVELSPGIVLLVAGFDSIATSGCFSYFIHTAETRLRILRAELGEE